MNKVLVISVLGLLLVSCVSAYYTTWSNPSVGFPEPHTEQLKKNCVREEWNNNFDKFRAGEISKEDMKIYVRSCN